MFKTEFIGVHYIIDIVAYIRVWSCVFLWPRSLFFIWRFLLWRGSEGRGKAAFIVSYRWKKL